MSTGRKVQSRYSIRVKSRPPRFNRVPHGPDPCVVRQFAGWVHRKLASDLLLTSHRSIEPAKRGAALDVKLRPQSAARNLRL